MYYFSETEKLDYGINRTADDAVAAESAIPTRRTIKFTQYPAISYLAGSVAITMPDFSGRDASARNYRTRIRNGLKSGPNFAGHYSLIEIGCGTSCRFAYIADAKNGEVFSFPYGGEEQYGLQLLYNLDSRLVKATWMNESDTCTQQDLEFNGREFSILNEITFPSASTFICN